MDEEKAQVPPPTERGGETVEWRGAKAEEFAANPTAPVLRDCLGVDVSVRLTTGGTWQGVLVEVKDNESVVLKPALRLPHGDTGVGLELPEKELAKSEMLWLRRNPRPSGEGLVGMTLDLKAITIEDKEKAKASLTSAEHAPGDDATAIEPSRACKECQISLPARFKFCGICGCALVDAKEVDEGSESEQNAISPDDGAKDVPSELEDKLQYFVSIAKCDSMCPECDWSAVTNDEFCRRCGYFLLTDAVFA